MSVSSNGTKGEPQFESTGNAPTFAADLDAASDYAALTGNRVVGTAGERAAYGYLYNGLDWYESDTTIVYRRIGGAWKAWESDWITLTPSLTNVAVGTGGSASSVHAYKYVCGDVRQKGKVVLGSSGASVTGAIAITFPVNRAALAHPHEVIAGGAVLFDTSANTPYLAGVGADGTNVDRFRIYPNNSGPVTTATTATNPFVWASTDAISYDLTYRPA